MFLTAGQHCSMRRWLATGSSLAALFAGVGPALAADDAAPDAPIELPKVSVTAPKPTTPDQALQQDGTADDGYAAKNLSDLGPLSGRKLLDTPYNASVVPRELIENVQVNNMTDMTKVMPFVQAYVPESNGTGSDFTIRGFGTGSIGGGSGVLHLQDGFRLPSSLIQDPENKERIEVITGVTGFLYGQNAPGGSINYVQKRPTATQQSSVTAGVYQNGLVYTAGDFSGPLEGGKLGYRLNVLEQDGNSYVDGETQERKMASAAFDAHVADNALLQVDLSYRYSYMRGLQSSWGIFTTGGVPSAPDPSKAWGEKWTYSRDQTYQGSTKFTWDVTNYLTSRTGLMYVYDKLDWQNVENDIYNGGSYDQTVNTSNGFLRPVISGYQYLDFSFDTFSIKHKITTGFNAYRQTWSVPYSWWTENQPYLAGLGNVNTGPVHVGPQNIFTGDSDEEKLRQSNSNKNFLIGDEITFNDQWSVLAGVTHSQILQDTYDPTSDVKSSGYNKSKDAPAISVIFKPVSWISTYASYLEGLDQGQEAPNTNTTTNRSTIMPPSDSKSYEVGTKAEVGKTLLTFSLFNTERAYDYLHNNGNGTNTFVQDGQEVHKGIELGISGKVTDDLTLYGGATRMLPEVTKSQTQNGTHPWEVSDNMAKFYAEYSIRQLPGLILIGGIQYVGPSPIWSSPYPCSGLYTPGYTTEDLGLRFQSELYGTPTTFRLNVNNITDRHYWVTDGYLGEPRTVAFSVQAKF